MILQKYCPVCDSIQKVETAVATEVYPVRGEDISLETNILVCLNCRNPVFDYDYDKANIEKAYKIYRDRHGVHDSKSIKTMRERYGLSQRGLAKIIGWSPATVYRYEKGDIPSPAHNDILTRIMEPAYFVLLLETNRDRLDEREYTKAIKAVNEELFDENELLWPVIHHEPSIRNGFKGVDLKKLFNMMAFFAQDGNVFKVGLMKRLFYADFLYFKKYSTSISGCEYTAISFGPCLNNWRYYLQQAEDRKYIFTETVLVPYEGDMIKTGSFEPNCFSCNEMAMLNHVRDALKGKNSKELADMSHLEDAWNKTANGEIISYEHALTLTNL